MGKQYRYIAAVQVRPRGAIGEFTTVEFPVILYTERATAGKVFDGWYRLAGDEFEPGSLVRVNGEFTKGMGVDYGFSGVEV